MGIYLSYHDSDGNDISLTFKNVFSVDTNYTMTKLTIEYCDDSDNEIERSFTIPFSRINRFYTV